MQKVSQKLKTATIHKIKQAFPIEYQAWSLKINDANLADGFTFSLEEPGVVAVDHPSNPHGTIKVQADKVFWSIDRHTTAHDIYSSYSYLERVYSSLSSKEQKAILEAENAIREAMKQVSANKLTKKNLQNVTSALKVKATPTAETAHGVLVDALQASLSGIHWKRKGVAALRTNNARIVAKTLGEFYSIDELLHWDAIFVQEAGQQVVHPSKGDVNENTHIETHISSYSLPQAIVEAEEDQEADDASDPFDDFLKRMDEN